MDDTNRTAAFFGGLISDAAPAESDLVLSLFDDASKKACFEHFWSRLQASQGSIDLDTLRLCIRLLPPADQDASLYSRLGELVINAIPKEASQPDRLYKLAELCLSNARFGSQIFHHVLVYLQALDSVLSPNLDEIDYHASHTSMDQRFPNAVAYLNFFKCSYWRPADSCHFVSSTVVQTLCNLTGLDGLDDAAHDALAALLSLLRTSVQALPSPNDGGVSASTTAQGPAPLKVDEVLAGQQLWNRYRELPDEYFASTSKVFRTWFQWICLAAANNVDVQGAYEDLYWARLRAGLLSGYSEQRKYCLGILRQTIQLSQEDIKTPLMVMHVTRRAEYMHQYEKYSSLFETIALDRYQNQIQACLPELTQLLGGRSLISPGWITALLSSVMNPLVQEGVRKLVGTWYVNLVIQESNNVFKGPAEKATFFDNNVEFLIGGLLPWATQGPLFTSKLTANRDSTICSHGEDLSSVIYHFIVGASPEVQPQIFADLCRFILDKGGRIFAYSIVYMLEGLFKGLICGNVNEAIPVADFALVPRIARLPGLPEVASDLITAYCAEACAVYSKHSVTDGTARPGDMPGLDQLRARSRELREELATRGIKTQEEAGSAQSLQQFLSELEKTQHKSIKDDLFPPACDEVMNFLNSAALGTVSASNLCAVFDALWEEADRQQYRRPVAVKLPGLFFHPTVVKLCVLGSADDNSLSSFLTNVLQRLRQLADGRSYVLSTLTDSLRKACFAEPQILEILPFSEFLLGFVEKPPLVKSEFLFEVAASEKLAEYYPHRTYSAYYGKREWQAYAAVVDLINRLPASQLPVATSVLEQLIEPWRIQKKSLPIITKWKKTFQLQAMLLLSEFCITEENAAWYLDSFMSALIVEQWPRYRYLLEWIISRIYYRFPHLSKRILVDLSKLDDTVPVQIASLMKLAVLAAPFLKSEDFTWQLMTQLVPFSASPKVQIRHEAQWAFPLVWDVAVQHGFSSVTGNPAFGALNDYIRSLEKFSKPAWTIRTLKLDVVKDFNLEGIFQGDYLTIESPERTLVTHSDFVDLWKEDDEGLKEKYPIRVPLGEPKTDPTSNTAPLETAIVDLSLTTRAIPKQSSPSPETTTPAPLQTKSGFDPTSLLPLPGPPTATRARPASIILVASLIDNPTNLGGLSRISESFGLESLTINNIRHVDSKDFQATAVTSHKHQPIQEVKVEDVPEFITRMKREGWEVVGVEQTDRSGMLGEEGAAVETADGRRAELIKGSGMLPKKCVLVLGSEKGGISSEVLAVVDRCVEIRTVGVTRSLNVQTAGGIAVFEWWREWGNRV